MIHATPMTLLPVEPAATAWRATPIAPLVEMLVGLSQDVAGRPRIVAVDGRSASGKSTLARRLADALAGSALVHTDDLAWYEPFFGWGHLLLDGVLAPLHRGESVALRLPAWVERGREGIIEVPIDAPWLVIEGVGAIQRDSAHRCDALIWVQSDHAEAERRGLERDIASGENGDREQTIAFWHEWMGHEEPFLADQRPWELADLVVAGTATIELGPGEVAIGKINSL